jgi:hypothetical protein
MAEKGSAGSVLGSERTGGAYWLYLAYPAKKSGCGIGF